MATPRLDRRTRTARAQGRDGRETLLATAAELFAERGFREASMDEVAARAGYSKGAVYWHFPSKDDLFFALVEERIDKPIREAVAELASASPDEDMVPAANRIFAYLLGPERDVLLLDHEYWAQAARDPKLRARYAARRAELRCALAKALEARMAHLGAPPLGGRADGMASVLLGLARGLAQQRLLDPDAVPDALYGETLELVYRGWVAVNRDR
jgi:AcrR family transcriptional regulator